MPLAPSLVTRLATIAQDQSVSVMIDHPDQLACLKQFQEVAGFPALVFVKVDSGYHRAGLPPTSLNKDGLLEKLAGQEQSGIAIIQGVYSHSSLSYGGTTPEEAMAHLTGEIVSCKQAIEHNSHIFPDRKLVVSVGATPQVVASRNLLNSLSSPEAQKLSQLLREEGSSQHVKIELHAGVYPVLDFQQLGTNALQAMGDPEDDVAISVVAEVCSVYNNEERAKPEALVAAGTLALGREPCQSYPGWGVVSSWRREGGMSRLIVERISQEHGIVAWEKQGDPVSRIPLQIGQTLRIYPNHACITGALYDGIWWSTRARIGRRRVLWISG